MFVARKAVMESVLPLLRVACPSVPIIFDTVDVHFVRQARQVRRLTPVLLHRCSGMQRLLMPSLNRMTDKLGSVLTTPRPESACK